MKASIRTFWILSVFVAAGFGQQFLEMATYNDSNCSPENILGTYSYRTSCDVGPYSLCNYIGGNRWSFAMCRATDPRTTIPTGWGAYVTYATINNCAGSYDTAYIAPFGTCFADPTMTIFTFAGCELGAGDLIVNSGTCASQTQQGSYAIGCHDTVQVTCPPGPPVTPPVAPPVDPPVTPPVAEPVAAPIDAPIADTPIDAPVDSTTPVSESTPVVDSTPSTTPVVGNTPVVNNTPGSTSPLNAPKTQVNGGVAIVVNLIFVINAFIATLL